MTKRCAAITNSGTQCKNDALEGSDFCRLPSHQAMGEMVMNTKEPAPEVNNKICGHVNRHSYDMKGELDFLECTLEKGHDGPHQAYHYEIIYSLPYRDEDNPRKIKRDIMEEGNVLVEWTDMAGTPADEIELDLSSIDLSVQPFQEKTISVRGKAIK